MARSTLVGAAIIAFFCGCSREDGEVAAQQASGSERILLVVPAGCRSSR
jgi:hypothetical protein